MPAINIREIMQEAYGEYIATATGLHYDGYQEAFVSRSGETAGGYMQFTCEETGDTICARSVDEAREKIENVKRLRSGEL